jgi:hypothetical protein
MKLLLEPLAGCHRGAVPVEGLGLGVKAVLETWIIGDIQPSPFSPIIDRKFVDRRRRKTVSSQPFALQDFYHFRIYIIVCSYIIESYTSLI